MPPIFYLDYIYDYFNEKHPNYRNFFVDPEPPLKTPPQKAPKLNWKELLSNYQKEKGHPLLPVNNKDPEAKAPKGSLCKVCGAPAEYLYFNDGKKRSQLKCKVCSSLSQVHPRHRNKARYFCPHCGHSLYLWKGRKDVSIYKNVTMTDAHLFNILFSYCGHDSLCS